MSESRRASTDAARRAAVELLRSGSRFLLCGHERPDADCLGSQAALASVLRALGKEVRLFEPDPVDRRYGDLGCTQAFETYSGGALPEHDVAVLLDFHELGRAGRLGEAVGAGGSRVLVIDHHPPSRDGRWDAAYLDSSAAATGLLVRRIARELEVPIDARAAEALFTALVADTGWFRYSNADAEAFAAAAELVELGARPARVYAALFQRAEPEQPIATGRLLASTRYHAGGKLAVAAIGGADARFEVDDALDLLRAVEGVEVALVLREARDGVRLSARSKKEYDVRELAARFGGGGHARAAGATLAGPLGEAVERAVEAALEGFAAAAQIEGARR